MNFYDFLKIIPNAFPQPVNDVLLSLPRNIHAASVITTDSDNKINSEYRNTSTISLPDDIVLNLIRNISIFYDSYLKQYYHQNLKQVEIPQFLCYDINGKYDVHNDSEDFIDGKLKRIANRDLTILAYLNDDYEGGELEFPDFGLKIKPKENMVIVFPSYYEFQHKVNPVTDGKRYTLAAWIETTNTIYPRPYNEYDEKLENTKRNSKRSF